MGQSLLNRIQAKLELLRLEKRYTRQRHRRSTFISNAIYVDGEYVYQTPNSTGSSFNESSRVDALHGEKNTDSTPQTPSATESPREFHPVAQLDYQDAPQRKKLHRFSSMPKFGPFGCSSKHLPHVEERRSSLVR